MSVQVYIEGSYKLAQLSNSLRNCYTTSYTLQKPIYLILKRGLHH